MSASLVLFQARTQVISGAYINILGFCCVLLCDGEDRVHSCLV